jgi:hypothetical protein
MSHWPAPTSRLLPDAARQPRTIPNVAQTGLYVPSICDVLPDDLLDLCDICCFLQLAHAACERYCLQRPESSIGCVAK